MKSRKKFEKNRPAQRGKPLWKKSRREPMGSHLRAPAKKAVSASVIAKQRAIKVASRAKDLHEAADRVHRRADQLHKFADEVHQNLEGSPQQHAPDSAAPALEIVTAETETRKSKLFPIIGVGASAGGYEAFADFLAKFPKDTGMALVLVQHLDPSHKSKLGELLGHTSNIPVQEATEGLDIAPNHVYVIPENTTMTIGDGRLHLVPRKLEDAPPMPVDQFFRSLAQQQQERAIGIILSGTGSDGTLGLEAIKGEGGITFAQDKRSAKHFGMPGSAIASGSVDFIMSPDEIALELGRLAHHPYVIPRALPKPREGFYPETLLQDGPGEVKTIFGHLAKRTGVDFAFYKQSTLKRRIIRRMVLHKLEKLEDYIPMVQESPAELDALFNDLLINVTSFFRDPETFQTLKKKIFPRLLKPPSREAPLRFWVCGCASGEEAYSLAMSLIEFFEQTSSHRQIQIFATDISEVSIEKARAGIYPQNIEQDVSAERLRRFFFKVNGSYQVHKSIRDMCVFARQNMLVDPPFSNLDLITCRNVLIYFGPALQQHMIPLFHYALRSPGFLMLGTSETIGASTEYFSPLDKKNKFYVKKPSLLRPDFQMQKRMRDTYQKEPEARSILPEFPQPKPLAFEQQVDRILLRDFSPGSVVVNSGLEVVHFRGYTSDYLEHPPGTANLNLLKMARESLTMAIRSLLNKAMRKDIAVKQDRVELRLKSHSRHIGLEVVPFRFGPASDRLFLVVFKELDGPRPAELPRETKSKSGRRQLSAEREVARLRNDLQINKESLQSIFEEQEATNEELKSANEEIQSSNEELASTNEELEIAKEELQSTNEELTTLNEELQNRNAELSQINDDLTNLLSSVNIAIIMVGSDLTIRRFTPVAERLFNLIPSDIGSRLGDLSRAVLLTGLDATVHQVIDNLTPIEREAQDSAGNWFLLRIRPYRTRDNKIDGAVIMLVDIGELRAAIDAILSSTSQPILVLDPALKVRRANEAFCRFFAVLREEVEGKPFHKAASGQLNLPNLRAVLEEILPRNKPVTDFQVEATFPKAGWRLLRVNARPIFEEHHGMQLILLALEDVTMQS
jgi:two-component system CheB/CheR fusion protein